MRIIRELAVSLLSFVGALAGVALVPQQSAHAQIVGEVEIGEGTTVGRGAVIGELPQDLGFDPTANVTCGWNVPLPLPSKTLTLLVV